MKQWCEAWFYFVKCKVHCRLRSMNRIHVNKVIDESFHCFHSFLSHGANDTGYGHWQINTTTLRKGRPQFEPPLQIDPLHSKKGAGPSDPRTRAPCSRGRIRAALAQSFQEHQARAPESASLLHTEGLKTSSEPRAARAATCRARVAAAHSPSRASHTACGQPEASPCVCCACTRDASAHFR